MLFTGLFGIAVTWKLVSSSLRALGARVRSGSYPGEEFALLAGSLITGLLLITPGFVTDAIGLLFLLPVIRRGVGGTITTRMEERLKELYEYMKL